MKKIIWLFIFLGVIYLYGLMLQYRPSYSAQAAAITQNNTEYLSPTFVPTRTPIPSATIGYQETVAVAQMTADEARRINAQVTSEFEQRILEQLQMTAAYEQRVQEIYSWTATAAVIAIPLTATQQAISNTQVLDNQKIISAQLTATQYAPTQYAVMVQAQESVRYVRMNNFARVAFMLSMSVFALGLTYFILTRPEPREQIEPKDSTVVMMKRETGQGNFSLVRTVVPCSPEQLTELAEKITTGQKTLAINQWEGAGTLFTRPIIHQVRGWMKMNGFAIATDDGQLAPTNEGLQFFIGWLESQELPEEYEFTDENPEKSNLPRQNVSIA